MNIKNKYRVDWQPGMRLTDATFRSTDEYHIATRQPLYALLARNGYGFIEEPIIKYEITDTTLSFIEIHADAVCFSGKLINLHFCREERPLFQNISLPDTISPIIIFLDLSSDDTISVSESSSIVKFCDADYKIIIKEESDHYNNPDAVPLARFVNKHGWEKDPSFIAPCLTISANGVLLRMASSYCSELHALISALTRACKTAQGTMVKSLVPLLSSIAMEVDSEADGMAPLHLVTLMQKVILSVLSSSEMEEGVIVPEKEACKVFVESYYTPYTTSYMVSEGIRLTRALVDLPSSFGSVDLPQFQNVPSAPPRPHGDGTRGRLNRQGGGFSR